MSDSITYTLKQAEYNLIFTIANSISGEKSKFAASKVLETIREKVTSQMKDGSEETPENITISFQKKILDGFYLGLTELTKESKVNTGDILQMKTACSILKMKNRFEKFVTTELETIPESDEAFDDEVVDEPFDGE